MLGVDAVDEQVEVGMVGVLVRHHEHLVLLESHPLDELVGDALHAFAAEARAVLGSEADLDVAGRVLDAAVGVRGGVHEVAGELGVVGAGEVAGADPLDALLAVDLVTGPAALEVAGGDAEPARGRDLDDHAILRRAAWTSSSNCTHSPGCVSWSRPWLAALANWLTLLPRLASWRSRARRSSRVTSARSRAARRTYALVVLGALCTWPSRAPSTGPQHCS